MATEPRHPLVDIKDSLSNFVSKTSELATAEIKPSAKAAGFGAAFFAGAAVFALHAVWMLVILVALGVGLLLQAVTPLGAFASLTLGFLVSVLFSLLVAAILFTFGRGKLKDVKKPDATLTEAKLTLDAVVDAVAARTPTREVVLTTADLPPVRDEDLEKAFGRP